VHVQGYFKLENWSCCNNGYGNVNGELLLVTGATGTSTVTVTNFVNVTTVLVIVLELAGTSTVLVLY
jgi:hypothetical protein